MGLGPLERAHAIELPQRVTRTRNRQIKEPTPVLVDTHVLFHERFEARQRRFVLGASDCAQPTPLFDLTKARNALCGVADKVTIGDGYAPIRRASLGDTRVG